MKNKNNKLKVTIILNKDGKTTYLYPSLKKTQNFIRNKAGQYLKMGFFTTLRVSYPDGSHNSGTFYCINELKWAYQAFIKEYL